VQFGRYVQYSNNVSDESVTSIFVPSREAQFQVHESICLKELGKTTENRQHSWSPGLTSGHSENKARLVAFGRDIRNCEMGKARRLSRCQKTTYVFRQSVTTP
jgi:hypothetical protein